MKKPFLLLKQFFAISIVGIGLTGLTLPQPSWADTGRSILQDLDPQQNDDPLAPRSDEVDNMGLFNLIHRFNRGNAVWNPEAQNQQLNDAAAAFKARQHKLLQQQQAQPQQQNQTGFQVAPPVITPK
ncbi:MAG: hypothetical protein SAK29_21255 [Scytonema sp. PMC 1069.18]|nr:hypothetical protein [Scytonema sp. PMC 1069.18]MEC4887083.1 hypothetical protein [Scytonema sp. PMC 1070.18]